MTRPCMGLRMSSDFCWLFMVWVSCQQFSRLLVRLKDHSSEPTSLLASLPAWSGSKRERSQAQQREQGEDPPLVRSHARGDRPDPRILLIRDQVERLGFEDRLVS